MVGREKIVVVNFSRICPVIDEDIYNFLKLSDTIAAGQPTEEQFSAIKEQGIKSL